MGCCYEYQMHSGGVDHYELHELHDDNLEALVSSNDCPVGERMGGATRFVEGSCADFEGFASDEPGNYFLLERHRYYAGQN